MFSTFGNLFITRPRQAEHADTRLDIRRHDPDQEGRRKKDGAPGENVAFDTDDNATVTIEALRIFLENFLVSLQPQKSDGGHKITAPQNHDPELATRPHADGEAAKAAGVYQHVAQKVDRNAPHASHTHDDTPPPVELAAADIRAIHQLLADLGPLTERGIEYLVIERSDSFLGSLVAAVEKAKNL
ncbi:MAG: hypothetical protein DYH13_03330 [Alphaproteobacteria bacterium PRO2]|nr:hypothetical protein [Alphaproteobacteria bacterium PRO2]